MKKSIVWLASYPKSGNTWARLFLANYVANMDTPLPIDKVRLFGTGDSIKYYYDKLAGREMDPTDIATVLSIRPRMLSAVVSNGADINVVKSHNIRTSVHGVKLVPNNLTRCAIYIIRNPLDMVMSYARHYQLTQAKAADAICSSENAIIGDKSSVTQFLGTWSEHVKSWTSKPDFPVLVLRYEDMLNAPADAFGRMLTQIGMPVDQERMERAIRFSNFTELMAQEEKTGFGEVSESGERFFGKGTAGHWRTELDPQIADRIKKEHRVVMKKHGYLK